MPIQADLDAVVEIHPHDSTNQVAWVTAKRTYRIEGDRLVRVDTKPLQHDLRDDTLEPKWPPGSDFWPFKAVSDVVVLGKAFAPHGRPVEQRSVSVRVGNARKRVQVFGDRVLERTADGAPRIGKPEPFTEMELVYTNAYGGRDRRLTVDDPKTPLQAVGLSVHHPGVYARNQSGKGYVVHDVPADGVALPNLEDPHHLLTNENVVVPDPALWYLQPLPCFLDWHFPAMFPRAQYLGAPPYHPVPDEEILEEVRRGFIPERWRELSAAAGQIASAPAVFFQEASLGMSFSDLREGTPVELEGMHPERERMTFTLPAAPQLSVDVEGDRQRVEAKLLHAVITPHEETVELTWVGIRDSLPRAFFPGLHGLIPITAHVDGVPVRYDTPEPIYPKIRHLERTGQMPSPPKPRRVGEPDYLEIMGGLLTEGAPRRDLDVWSKEDSPCFGDVDVARGRVLLEEVDFELAGPFPLSFRRFYSSSMAWRSGPLGLGWSHCLDQAVWEEDGWIYYRGEDGRELAVPLERGALGLGASAHQPHHGFTVRKVSSDRYEVWLADGRRFELTSISSGLTVGPVKARLSRCWSVEGAYLDLSYDAHGRLARLLLASGQHLRFEHDARGRLHRVLVPTADASDWALAARYEVDGSGQLREAVDGRGRSARYRYRERLLVSHTTRAGLNRRFRYEGFGDDRRCVAESFGETGRELFLRDGGKGGVRDAEAGSFSFCVNEARELRSVIGYGAEETTRAYDEATGLLGGQTSPDGETTFLYDAGLHLADIAAPDRGSTVLEHDGLAHLVLLRDGDARTARWAWDSYGRLSAVIAPDGSSVVYGFEETGALVDVVAPGDAQLTLERDPRTRAVTRVLTPFGVRTATRDALGRVVSVEDEAGTRTTLRYDPSGRVRRLAFGGELEERYDSDARGRVTTIRSEGSETSFERDETGRIVAVLRGGEGCRLHRDAEGRVKMIASEAFDLFELERDAAGRLWTEGGFEGMTRRTVLRDPMGRVRRETRGIARSEVTRDRAGRPTELEHSDGTFQRFSWSPGGELLRAQESDRITSFERDGEGRVTLEARASDGVWVRSGYGALGRRRSLTSSLGLSVQVRRDAAGRALGYVAERGGQRLELRFERDGAGREARRHLPGALSVGWVYDDAGRVVERSVAQGVNRLATARWEWRGSRRMVRFEDEGRTVRHHRYDARGRLIQIGSVVRVLDEVGNVFFTEARDDHDYAPGGRLIDASGTEYRHDDAGRRTEKRMLDGSVHRYRWDARGRLIEVALSDDRRVAYDYDGLGRLVARRSEQKNEIEGFDEAFWDVTSQTSYVWDGLELLHEITDGAVTSWLWEGGRLLGKLDERDAYAVLTDPLGLPTELTTRQGALAWRGWTNCFGDARLQQEDTRCPWRFPGHHADPETGLLHAWLRVFDPETGSYLSPNPLGIAAGTNLYGYVDDPMVQASPLGLARGYAAFAGALRAEHLEGELVERLVAALDREDGAAGPRSRFDLEAATPKLPDAEALLYGDWESYRPSRRLPPRSATFRRLPDACPLRSSPIHDRR